jgi:anti-sigma factor RsiW
VRCEFVNSLLHGYFDSELNPPRAAEFERHLLHCSECDTELVDLDLLRARLQIARLYASAPASLRRKARANLSPVAVSPVASKPLLWHWLVAAAALLLFAIGGWKVNRNLRNDDYRGEFAQEIVEAHITSLHPGNTTGIASNDPHVVREWFESTLKFTVPVPDLGKDGFPLQGGRVDAIEGRPFAALVYAHDGHTITVFIWPAQEPDSPPRTGSRQGYQWVEWQKTQTEFCAVSDAGLADLKRLQSLIFESLSSHVIFLPGPERWRRRSIVAMLGANFQGTDPAVNALAVSWFMLDGPHV